MNGVNEKPQETLRFFIIFRYKKVDRFHLESVNLSWLRGCDCPFTENLIFFYGVKLKPCQCVPSLPSTHTLKPIEGPKRGAFDIVQDGAYSSIKMKGKCSPQMERILLTFGIILSTGGTILTLWSALRLSKKQCEEMRTVQALDEGKMQKALYNRPSVIGGLSLIMVGACLQIWGTWL